MGARKKALPAPLVTASSPEEIKLRAAREWCAAQFKARYNSGAHASFLAGTILEEASKRYKLADYGVEGWAHNFGRTGVQYLNYGDPYTPTIYVRSGPYSASFYFSRNGWASAAG